MVLLNILLKDVEKSAKCPKDYNHHTEYHVEFSCTFLTKQFLEALEFVVVHKKIPSKISTAEGENSAKDKHNFCGYHSRVSPFIVLFAV